MKHETVLARTLAAKRLFRKRLRTAVLAAVLLAALAAMGVYAYYRSFTNDIQHNEGYYYPSETETSEEITGLAVSMEHVDAGSLDEFLRVWAKNDIQKLQDKNVLNILLCGVDTENGKGLGGRSDAMILASLNRREKTITLTSLFRDSYTYIDLSNDAANPRALMDRVNSAYSVGGPATLVDTLENNYKIIIDNYISVDFKSFPKLIDALGGVRVDVTGAEAAYINRTSPSMKGKFPAGKQVKLNGQQALVFTRIRKLDSDVNRSARQRQVIEAILRSARDASPRQILDALRQTLQHVATSLSEDEIDRLSKDALTQGWLKYEVRQEHSPTVEDDEAHPTGYSAYIGGRWLWVVDYPREAQRLQEKLYGVTSIALSQAGRDDYLAELFRKAKDPVRTTRPATKQATQPAATTSAETTTAQPAPYPWATTQPPETGPITEAATQLPETEPTTEAPSEISQENQTTIVF